MKRPVNANVIARLGIAAVAAGALLSCPSPAVQEKDQEMIPKSASEPEQTKSRESMGQQPQKKPKVKTANKTPERDAIEEKYTWNTSHLFPSDGAWEKERKAIVGLFPGITQCKGKLKRGKRMVMRCLERVFEARKRLERLANYAHRKHDQDTRVTKYQGYKQVVEKVGTEFLEVTSFLQPELLALPTKTLRGLIADKGLSDYDQYLREILRLKPHILSPKEEALLAATSLLKDTGYHAYSAFSGADLKFPTIKDEQDKEVELTQALFTQYRTSPVRRVRKATFEAFFGTYKRYRNMLASLLSSQINAEIVYSKARRYKSALEASLDANNVPTSVYYNMVKAVNKHLPTLHRYLKLRRDLLGLKELRYYDMYPPIVKQVELKYPYEKGRALLLEALGPMGEEYLRGLKQGLKPESGWIDVFPNQGKRSGAYMDSVYDTHPFVLCNYLDNYNSVSTLAHEMGHAMHSYFSNKNQPFAKANYPIFVAEVASTLNESLLMAHMLKEVEEPRKRLYLLGQKLEDFRQTIFRQAMFAEFELAIYERAEKKEALTAEQLSKTYLEIARRYYGHSTGVVLIDDLYGMEWAYVPHFYYNYYVFQYVTGLTAATALSLMIQREGAKARDRYVKHMLKAGGSDYPIELLKRAGVDLTTTKPYEIAMEDFRQALEQAEELVRRTKRSR